MTDLCSSKDGTGTSQSETSKEGGLSEDIEESAEDSEKTQTTSDAESGGDNLRGNTLVWIIFTLSTFL